MYTPVDPKVSFPELEKRILEFWKKSDIFKRSIAEREGADEFVFYDGPPFATGLPHYGNFVPGIIKDIIPRFKTMQGMKVERRFGWDCHGLPVEYEMEKELGISGKKQIEDYGVAKFNEACRSIVLRYTREWETITTRLGRWVDFENDYKTMDADYMESIWWVFRQLWEKKLIYEGHYVLPYCPRCSTVLSNHELNLGGYENVQDPAITVKFKLVGEENTYFLAWTTTPWTLPSNLALAVGENIEYVKVQDGVERYILARTRLGHYYRDIEKLEIVESFTGKDLAGLRYEPLFPYFADLFDTGAFKIFTADYVTTEDGTGIVHTAPGFGEDDYETLRGTGIPTVCPVDAECKFTAEVSDYQGVFVKDADKSIMDALKQEGKLVRRESYYHSYPHCWRCSSPLIYRAVSSWFVNVQAIKEKMLEANDSISWVPDHVKKGRFGKWIENARDWAISRNRYWGNPLPVWRCSSCGETECFGSRKELEERSGAAVGDLHKHFVDEITFPCSCGGTMKRISEVLDCWFESGAMPYGQNHYPFERKEHFEANFPADFIAEGLDQTRGWFYTLTILAAALFSSPAFKQVVVNGIVLTSEGKKMSKSAKNYTDPSEVIAEFGADALRLFLMNSAVVRAEDLRYSNDGVREVLKNMLIPLWNAYSFFVTYANIDGIAPTAAPVSPDNPLDRWILSETERLVEDVTVNLESYDIQKAIQPLENFIDILNNWYIRRSRRRFWRSENDLDKEQAYQTLYAVLMKVVRVAAPFIPFVTEEMYLNLKSEDGKESVHLTDFPVADRSMRDPALEYKMQVVRSAVSMGRALRSVHSIKTRQPLKAIHLVTRDDNERKVLREMEDIVRDELNVKEVVFRENEEDLVEFSVKPNYRALGKELGKDMKAAAQRISELSKSEILSLLEGATLSIDLGDKVLELDEERVIVQREEKENLKVLNEGSLTIALDPEITAELYDEGVVRDIVRSVQNLRKDRGLDVTDRIVLRLHGSDAVRSAVEGFQDHLMEETLATVWEWERTPGGIEIECGDETCVVDLEKKS
ncbi:MAG: isoleucine--tRNA ligase [Spirochaetales bacterium]|nr:isoleucine--tRNA ligase [Spirochaetales bacterium]